MRTSRTAKFGWTGWFLLVFALAACEAEGPPLGGGGGGAGGAVCGDGRVEAPEACDGNAADCAALGRGRGTAACRADCSGFDETTCAPAGEGRCGDGVRDPGEACDGELRACGQIPGYAGGGAAPCRADCKGWDVSGCGSTGSPVCGNAVREPGEACDTERADCAAVGDYGQGTAWCRLDCKGWEIATCSGSDGSRCGDGVRNGGEACDGDTLACRDLGAYAAGVAFCRPDCRGYDETWCEAQRPATCGDGVRDPGEVCDRQYVSCASLGAGDSGTAWCRADCSGYDRGTCGSACVPACAGRACGPDGCGGSCGACPAGAACDGWGACRSTSAGAVTGSLTFDARVARFAADGRVLLDQVQTFAAAEAVVLVVAPDGTVEAAAQVGADGAFTIPLSTPLTGDEFLYIAAAWAPSLDSPDLKLAVLQPQAGGEPRSVAAPIWVWTMALQGQRELGAVHIDEANGAGAMYLFLFTLAGMQTLAADMLGGDGEALESLAVLWSPGVDWSCGACYAHFTPQTLEDGARLGQSIYIGGAANGSSAWGWPTTLHELGHYAAHNFSRDDSPGGPHSIGQVIAPAFAWSEGWASFFAMATMSRWVGQPVSTSWDIQGGSSFWQDYAAGAHSGGLFVVPDLTAGLTQWLDESWVATMLWHLWDGLDVAEDETGDDGVALGTGAVLRAVTSPRFLRGDRGAPDADFVDFVDAALCASPGRNGAVTGLLTGLRFPYDGAPSCAHHAPRAPLTLALSGERVGGRTRLTATVEAVGRLPAPPVLQIALPAGATLATGAAEETLPPLAPGARLERVFEVAGAAAAPVDVSVSAPGPGMGAHAAAAWPAAEPAPAPAVPALRPVPPVRLFGVTLDRAVRLPALTRRVDGSPESGMATIVGP
jgi:hypothetical protein